MPDQKLDDLGYMPPDFGKNSYDSEIPPSSILGNSKPRQRSFSFERRIDTSKKGDSNQSNQSSQNNSPILYFEEGNLKQSHVMQKSYFPNPEPAVFPGVKKAADADKFENLIAK